MLDFTNTLWITQLRITIGLDSVFTFLTTLWSAPTWG